MHPEIATMIAASRTKELMAEADARRLARDARRPARLRFANPFRRPSSVPGGRSRVGTSVAEPAC